MIGNVYRGSGFRGLVEYLADGDGASLLLTNLAGESPRDFARQVGEVRTLYPRDTIARPVVHVPFRAAPGEDLTDEQWQQVAELALERLGFENSPFVAYLHDHGDGRHLHIATYRVDYDGRLVSDSNDRRKVEALSREFEDRFGLRKVESKSRFPLKRPEFERQLKDPDRARALAALRQAIDQAASAHDTLRGFMTELSRLGVRAELKTARASGKVQGIRFQASQNSVVAGSKLGKDYSLAAICRRHDLRINLVPDERTLVVGDVTRTELDGLAGTALAPDSIRRTGSRFILAWALPENPAAAQDIADLVAHRLPHRFLSFSDRALGSAPGRAAREELAGVVGAFEPVAPPALISTPLPEADTPSTRPSFSDRIAQCQHLGEALSEGGSFPELAELRMRYRTAMEEVFDHQPFTPEFHPDEKTASHPPVFHPDELSAFSLQDLQRRQETAGTEFLHRLTEGNLPRAQAAAAALSEASGATENRLAELVLIASSAYEKHPTAENHARWAALEQQRRLNEQIARTPIPEAPEPALLLETLKERLLAAQDLHHSSPTEDTASGLSAARLAYERLARHLTNANAVRLRSRDPVPAASDPLEALREVVDAQRRYLAEPTSERAARAWSESRDRYAATLARVESQVMPAPTRRNLVKAHQSAERELRQASRTLESSPRDAEALTGWSQALAASEAATAALRQFDESASRDADSKLRQAAADLTFYEAAFFRRPSEVSERLWRLMEQAHLRASLDAERARLRLTACAEGPKSSRSRVGEVEAAGQEVSSIADKILLGLQGKATNLTRSAARRAWARTEVGRTFLTALHPLQAAASMLPGGRVGLEAAGIASQLAVRTLVNYTEIRAAVNLAKGGARRFTLEQGNLSSKALARAVFKNRVPVPVLPQVSVMDSVLGSRRAEAHLLRAFRSYRRGLADPQLLHWAAANALAARGAVTLSLNAALGLPTPSQATAIFGKTSGRASTALVGGLEALGLSPRAIALSLIETAPALAAAGLAAGVALSARQIVRFASGYARQEARRLLREQHEHQR